MEFNSIKSALKYFALIILFLLLISSSKLSAQNAADDKFPYTQKEETASPPFRDRLFYGGNVGLTLGTITDVQISPVVGYWLLPRIAVAIGPTYRYYKYQYDKTSIYGGKTYIQIVLIEDINSVLPVGVHTGIFIQAEDELLSLKTSYWKYPPYLSDRFYVNTVLLGGGISQQVGRRSTIDFAILWPLNDSSYEIYSKPEIRVSFIF